MSEAVMFWVLAPVMVFASLSLLLARKAVHVAMGMVTVMVSLAAMYIQQDAEFLGVVQIVVYTGAVMMLFLFVLMLVGVDQRESLKETIAGQRWIALGAATGLAFLLVATTGRVAIPLVGGLDRENSIGNPEAIADRLFGSWVLVMEILGILLVVAAVGALVLTHLPRLAPPRAQRERAEQRIKGKLDPVNKPMPGVYARHNALDIPALDPLGNPIEASISRVLRARRQDKDGAQWRAIPAPETDEGNEAP